jgi:hypothetical protein
MRIKSSHIIIILVSVSAVLVSSAYVLYSGQNVSGRGTGYMATDSSGYSQDGSIHWHPKLSIHIDGQRQHIPKGIGIVVGNVIDTDISRMRMSPMHTHDDDGIIHMEQTNPTDRTLRLGYFFEVWGKRFDSDCIFEFCSGGGKTVRMFVKGAENFEFDDYVPKDGDDIIIVYG